MRYKVLLRSLSFLFAITIAAGTLYAISTRQNHPRASLAPLGFERHPRIQIADQPDSPLRILSAKTDSATVYVPEADVVILNRGVQPIRAYTLRYQTISKHSKGGGMELTSASSINSLLLTGQTATATLGEGTSYSDPIKRIIVSVDFVEFADGTTWGPDEYKSSESLAGQRAGAYAAKEHFIKRINENGPVAVMRSIEGHISDVIPPSGHSPEWLNGFDGGVGAVSGRLKSAYIKNGAGGLESELRRPFDASDRK